MKYKNGRLEKTMRYLDWSWIAMAVLEVFRENERNGNHANAEHWTSIERSRRNVFDRSLLKWCELTGLGQEHFPYSVDATTTLYMKFRKRNDQEIADFTREAEAAMSLCPRPPEPEPIISGINGP